MASGASVPCDARQAGLDDDAQRRGAGQRHRAQPPVGERAHQRERSRRRRRRSRRARRRATSPAPRGRGPSGSGARDVRRRRRAPRRRRRARRRRPGSSPSGDGGHAAAHARAEAAAGASRACARPGARRVQAPRRADPRARRGVEGGARGARDLHAPQQLRPEPIVHHRHAALGQRRPPPASPGATAPARSPCRAGDAVADGQRPRVEHVEAPAGGRVHARPAGRDGDPDRRGAEVAREHRERRRRARRRRGGHHPEVEGARPRCPRRRRRGARRGRSPPRATARAARAGRPPGRWSRRAARPRWCRWPAARRAPERARRPAARGGWPGRACGALRTGSPLAARGPTVARAAAQRCSPSSLRWWRQPRGVQLAGGDRRLHRAAGLGLVAAVGEPAAGGQRLHVGEGGRHADGIGAHARQAQARRVDQQRRAVGKLESARCEVVWRPRSSYARISAVAW